MASESRTKCLLQGDERFCPVHWAPTPIVFSGVWKAISLLEGTLNTFQDRAPNLCNSFQEMSEWNCDIPPNYIFIVQIMLLEQAHKFADQQTDFAI